MNISSFVIALVFVSIVVGGFGFLAADIAVNYNVDYDNNTFANFDMLYDLQSQAEQINTSISDIQTSSGAVDVVGDLLKGGYEVIKVTWSSFNIFTGFATQSKISLGEVGVFNSPIMTLVSSGLLIIALLLFLFAIVSVLIGRNV